MSHRFAAFTKDSGMTHRVELEGRLPGVIVQVRVSDNALSPEQCPRIGFGLGWGVEK